MTAPLTPHDQPPPFPPYPGGGPVGGKGDGPSVAVELRRAALVAVAVTVCGVILALLWVWLSPRIPLVSDGKAVYLKDTEGEEAIGSDGMFVLISLVLGALTAVGVFLRYRRGGVALVLALAVGGVLAAVVGWRLGIVLGPTRDLRKHAMDVGANVVFDGPLKLRAKSALIAWPAAAMLVHSCLTWAFGPRDPELPPYIPPAQWGAPPPPAPQPPNPNPNSNPNPAPEG